MNREIDLLIHGALWREVSATLSRLKLRPVEQSDLTGSYYVNAQWKYYEGSLNSKRVGLIISGMGRRRTRQALKWLRRLRDPKRIVSIGTGGALDSKIPLGQIWLVEWVASLSNIHSEGKYFLEIPEALKKHDSGGLVTVAKPILKQEIRDQIREGCGAKAVDMEGVAVARWAKKRDLPYSIVKVLTDYSNESTIREYTKQVASASKLLSNFCYDIIMEWPRIWPDTQA
jgi:nucleoside phosphorylase